LRKPLVSIIIPTFNREKELERAINSVLSQTFTNWEICIIDNNSTDNSIQLINRYNDSRIRVFMIHNNGIIGASRNLGIKKSKGKYLAFLDSDDWWSSRKLEKSIKVLEQGDASLVYHDLYTVNNENQKFFFKKTKSRKLSKPIFEELLIYGNTICTSSVVIRKNILTKISGFTEDSRFAAGEDFDAWLTIAESGEIFSKIPKVLGCYWVGQDKTTNSKRTIQILNDLEVKFKNIIIEKGLSEKTYSFNFIKAREYAKLNMKAEALMEFKNALLKKPILLIKLKILILIIILRIEKFMS
jgi:glycosyltransferase involved in cell wall biosynthesis